MAKYVVEVVESSLYSVHVEAANEEEAQVLALSRKGEWQFRQSELDWTDVSLEQEK